MNYEKCDVALRGQLLISFAAKYLGETTAKVYGTFLQCLEEKIPRCLDCYALQSKDEEIQASPSATNEDVLRVLDPNVDLSYGMPSSDTNGVNGFRGHGGSYDEDDSDEDVKRPVMNESHRRAHLVDTHMHLLSSDPRKFVNYVSSRGGGEWKVDFRSLTAALLQDHLESSVEAKFGDFGPKAAKVIRILFNKGKLDEKQVAHFAMFRQKDVRGFLTHLQEAGYVDCQEVPKDNSRTVNKTMFFWFFDQDRCRKLLLSDTYKAMARILQRIRVEREYIQPVIDKAERLDVVGREEEYLSEIEKNALKDWAQVEEKMLTQLSRLDDSVGILRDFYMPPLPA
jgi:DNA-directed RNA polymerase III subunit RPC3